jgi:ribose 5-phosphate isomerase A
MDMGMADQSDQVDPVREWKRAAARAAIREVADGMIVGLGSGSTAELMVEELAALVRQGLRVTGVASSERTAALAANLGIPLLALNDAPGIDVNIDGADEVSVPELALVKGRGGALLREKLVAAASHRRVIIVDESKLVTALGARHPLPVEVVTFGWVHTARRLAGIGLRPTRRMAAGQTRRDSAPQPFLTDGGNYILDCETGPVSDPEPLGESIKSVLGVVEHGLFVRMTERVIAAGPSGVQVFDRLR